MLVAARALIAYSASARGTKRVVFGDRPGFASNEVRREDCRREDVAWMQR